MSKAVLVNDLQHQLSRNINRTVTKATESFPNTHFNTLFIFRFIGGNRFILIRNFDSEELLAEYQSQILQAPAIHEVAYLSTRNQYQHQIPSEILNLKTDKIETRKVFILLRSRKILNEIVNDISALRFVLEFEDMQYTFIWEYAI